MSPACRTANSDCRHGRRCRRGPVVWRLRRAGVWTVGVDHAVVGCRPTLDVRLVVGRRQDLVHLAAVTVCTPAVGVNVAATPAVDDRVLDRRRALMM